MLWNKTELFFLKILKNLQFQTKIFQPVLLIGRRRCMLIWKMFKNMESIFFSSTNPFIPEKYMEQFVQTNLFFAKFLLVLSKSNSFTIYFQILLKKHLFRYFNIFFFQTQSKPLYYYILICYACWSLTLNVVMQQ